MGRYLFDPSGAIAPEPTGRPDPIAPIRSPCAARTVPDLLEVRP